jgi:hypothetical protein
MQDRWTVDRLTVSGGVRIDLQNESTEPFSAGPHRWLPTRNITLPAVENVPNWRDINPRVSMAYDLFGNGKTAVKASASRGVQQDSIGTAAANNPATTLVNSTARVWEDDDADFTPDCDLANSAAQGTQTSVVGANDGIDFCGGWLTPTFGSRNPSTAYDPAIMNGWGVRPWNWEFSVGLQQELIPRVSASVGYFRRINGNFQITDNEALSRDNFTQYSVTVPTDARLPNSGQSLGGLFDQNFVVGPANRVKDAANFGKQIAHWDGFDVNIDARLSNGLFIQGGLSTGKDTTDNCDIVDDVPELLNVAGAWRPVGFCHVETPYLTQYKALASYTLPWWDVRVSGTYQSLPGPEVGANNIYNNAVRPTLTTLARPFTLAQANVNLIQPGTVYGDRLNQFDLRFTKIVPVGKGRVDLNVDLYNAFNSDAILTQLNNFGPAWQLPLSVIQPRFVKFSARWDF